jgi:hypothetical protein
MVQPPISLIARLSKARRLGPATESGGETLARSAAEACRNRVIAQARAAHGGPISFIEPDCAESCYGLNAPNTVMRAALEGEPHEFFGNISAFDLRHPEMANFL